VVVPGPIVRFAVHDAVPFVRTHVTLSVLNSTVWIPSSSEAFPFTVTFAYRRTVEFDGNVIVICGGIVSGIGSPGSTFTRIGADRVSDPLVPVTSTLNWPGVLPFITQAAVPEPGMLVGEQTVVTPVGSEVAVRPTVSEKPPVAMTEIVEEPDSPATKERAAGSAEREKSGTATGGLTSTDTKAVWTRLPLAPVIVTA